jgi:nucleoside-diphosphate-sugar epimerase
MLYKWLQKHDTLGDGDRFLHQFIKMPCRTVLVIGGNGFLGSAVAKAFSLAGWTTYGLIRSQKSASSLLRNEVIPVIGSATDPSFLSTLPAFDVVVSTTEDINNYLPHFNDTVSLLKIIAKRANKKLLVLFTSGCKDYGTTAKHGEAGLAPHTEENPPNPPKLVANRTKHSITIFDHKDEFDAVLLRPTTLYGYSGSYYAPFFIMAQQARSSGTGTLTINGHPNAILHGTHVDDVAAAYLAIALAPRAEVAGQTYNISSHRYETLEEIRDVMEKSYGVKIAFKEPEKGERKEDKKDFLSYLIDFPQWVGSDKLRERTGWVDQKQLFSEGFELYRKVYEQAVEDQDEGIVRIANMFKLEDPEIS